MMKYKKVIAMACMVVCAVVLIAASPFEASATPEVKVTIDGNQVSFPDQKPVIVSDRTLVPVRFVSQELGATVDWVDATRDVVIKKGTDTIVMRIDSKTLSKNGNLASMDVAPTIMSGRTMVPLRFVSENLGVGVKWDPDTYTVVIVTTLKPGNVITLPADADEIDKLIKELALDCSSWGNLYTANREATKEFCVDLAEIGANLGDTTTRRTAGFYDANTKDGNVKIAANCNDEIFGTHNLVLYQEKLTMMSYDAMWVAINTLFSDEDSVKIWTSYVQLINNMDSGTYNDVTGTAGGYNYTCKLFGRGFAITFDK